MTPPPSPTVIVDMKRDAGIWDTDMDRETTTLLMEKLAFRSGSRYYPFRIIKVVDGSGETTYTIETRIGEQDVIISDASSLEEALKAHEELLECAFETRDLQGRALKMNRERTPRGKPRG